MDAWILKATFYLSHRTWTVSRIFKLAIPTSLRVRVPKILANRNWYGALWEFSIDCKKEVPVVWKSVKKAWNFTFRSHEWLSGRQERKTSTRYTKLSDLTGWVGGGGASVICISEADSRSKWMRVVNFFQSTPHKRMASGVTWPSLIECNYALIQKSKVSRSCKWILTN